MSKLLALTGLAFVSLLSLAPSAQAQHVYSSGGAYGYTSGGVYGGYQGGLGIGGTPYGVSQGGLYSQSYNSGFQSYSPSPYLQPSTHYDFHPTTIYRHRGHYDVQPGHYDLHQSVHSHW